jgi:hypothetical protein
MASTSDVVVVFVVNRRRRRRLATVNKNRVEFII